MQNKNGNVNRVFPMLSTAEKERRWSQDIRKFCPEEPYS